MFLWLNTEQGFVSYSILDDTESDITQHGIGEDEM